MSAQPRSQVPEPMGARVLEVSDLPVSHIRGYATEVGNVYFERRGGRTFLVTDR